MNKEQYDVMYRLEDSLWWYVGMRAITGSLLRAAGRTAEHCDVLDAGCGTGGTLSHLPDSCRGTGIDFSLDALDLARERGLSRLVHGSVEHLPFAEASFDLVLCSDVIYHLGVTRDVDVLAEFCRVLRPGGLAVVRVPAYDWLRGAHDLAVHTRHRYTGAEMRRKMEEAGFRAVRATHANAILFPLAVAKRMTEGTLTSATSELEQPSPRSNWLALQALKIEARLVSLVDLPWGLSVISVGRKPEGPASRDSAQRAP